MEKPTFTAELVVERDFPSKDCFVLFFFYTTFSDTVCRLCSPVQQWASLRKAYVQYRTLATNGQDGFTGETVSKDTTIHPDGMALSMQLHWIWWNTIRIDQYFDPKALEALQFELPSVTHLKQMQTSDKRKSCILGYSLINGSTC